MVKQGVSNAPYDKTRRGVIKAVDTDTQTYTVSIDGVLYHNVKPLSGSSVRAGDVVNVIYPTNNPSQMMIYGVTDMTQSEISDFINSISQNGRAICPYDVGDIYETANSANPSTKWENTTWSLMSSEYDYVVEEGTDGMWTYRKWYSGIAECWGNKSFPSATFASGAVKSIGVDYPSNLFITGKPSAHVSGYIAGGADAGISYVNSTLLSLDAYIKNVGSSSATNIYAGSYYAIGQWKEYAVPITTYKWRRLS